MRYSLLLFISILFIQCTKPANDTEAWYEVLPECPCIDPDINGVVLDDGWARDQGGSLTYYHPGASKGYRSYPRIKTTEGWSGQQCIYDENGELMTDGAAAGTPDKVSTCIGEDKEGNMKKSQLARLGHKKKDVDPWVEMGWEAYNELWKPSQGDCN